MKQDVCFEYIRLKEREKQCSETSEYFRVHPEYGELTSKRAAEQYHQRSLEARRECAEHSRNCPVCKGQTTEWT